MVILAHILPSIYVLSSILTSISCDYLEEVKEAVEKSGTENLHIIRDDQLHEVAIRNLNYPAMHWNENVGALMTSKACTKFPSPNSVQFENSYWQIFETNFGITFRLYNSYLDDRKLVGKKMVRILAMVNRKTLNIPLKCLLWFKNSTFPITSEVSEYRLIWRLYWLPRQKETVDVPFLISCPVPDTHEDVPVAVTLAEQSCGKTSNVLKVIYDKPSKKEQFAICTKGLDFPFWDISLQLVEWIEMCRLLGVNKIFFYTFQVHTTVQDVLNYYIKTGFVEVTPTSYSLGKPYMLRVAYAFRDIVKRYEQVIAYNDCWNRNLYKYEHISLLDTDELIIPLMVETWPELINDIETVNQKKGGKKFASYAASEGHFVPAMGTFSMVPSYMTIMRRVLRLPITPRGYQSKSIHDTEMVLTLHNHYAIDILHQERIHEMNVSLAQVNHYRYCNITISDCSAIDMKNGTIDVSLWKYLKPLKKAVEQVLKNVEPLKNKYWMELYQLLKT